MKPFISTKYIAAAALAVAAFGAASVAHAGSDLHFSIGFQGPSLYVEPAPVYVQPRPVYVQPPTYIAPVQGYARRDPSAYGYEQQYQDERVWRRSERRERHDRFHQQERHERFHQQEMEQNYSRGRY